VLRDNKEAISWTMANIKRLSPSIVQHRIYLIEEAKSKRDPQCWLNPIMQEVTRVEIVKHWIMGSFIPYPIVNGLVMSMLYPKRLVLQW